MHTMRSHCARSSTECVVNTTVAERSARWRRRETSSAPVIGSRPDVGSSRKKTWGSVSSSTAMLARLRCPPLSEPTRTSPCPVRPTASIASPTASSTSVALVDEGSRSRGGVAEHAPKGQFGVDDVFLGYIAEHAAERPEVGVQVDAVVVHRPRGRRADPGDRLEQRRLPGSARTDDRDELAGAHGERRRVEQVSSPRWRIRTCRHSSLTSMRTPWTGTPAIGSVATAPRLCARPCRARGQPSRFLLRPR